MNVMKERNMYWQCSQLCKHVWTFEALPWELPNWTLYQPLSPPVLVLRKCSGVAGSCNFALCTWAWRDKSNTNWAFDTLCSSDSSACEWYFRGQIQYKARGKQRNNFLGLHWSWYLKHGKKVYIIFCFRGVPIYVHPSRCLFEHFLRQLQAAISSWRISL